MLRSFCLGAKTDYNQWADTETSHSAFHFSTSLRFSICPAAGSVILSTSVGFSLSLDTVFRDPHPCVAILGAFVVLRSFGAHTIECFRS